ncbi:MAG TPA: hypothetical protein EYG70_06595 [Sulfurimonas sp.]|nr:hypothetical protein [Sulfurimonas sp.]
MITHNEAVSPTEEKTFRFKNSAGDTEEELFIVTGVVVFQNVGADDIYIAETPFTPLNRGLLVSRNTIVNLSEATTLNVRGNYEGEFFVKGEIF